MSQRIRTTSFAALGTTATVAIAGDAEQLASSRDVVARWLDEIDRSCSRFRADSELSRANAAAGTTVGIGDVLVGAIEAACAAAEATGGLVDPLLGRSMRAAGYDRSFALLRGRRVSVGGPSPAQAGRWRDLALDPASGTVRVPIGVELDLGATAKAWAADAAAATVAAALGVGTLVSLGGDIAVAGPAPSAGWTVRVDDDHAAPLDGPGPVVSIRTGGLATSSVALRRWATDDGEAHHVLDPRTGRPAATRWRSATVAGATCLDANTAATAALVLADDAPRWLDEHGLPSRLVRFDGSAVCVGGWPAEVLVQ